MKRYLEEQIAKDLKRKMVLLTGPRQVGKTYMSKQIAQKYFNNFCYLNFDNPIDADVIIGQKWPRSIDLLILDEIHKMSGWKNFLKGVYDTKLDECALLVTGSSRMDTFRQAGPSLAGRYFHHSLWPISVAELKGRYESNIAFEKLLQFGGFPEPFLSDDLREAKRWRAQYFTDIVREDILEFGRLQEIRTMRLLLELLRKRVGSPLSYTSLSSDLQASPNTIKNYIQILEALHIIFLLRPFHRNMARAIQKIPKLYFYDSGLVIGDVGLVTENVTAVCLKKYTDFRSETTGEEVRLAYLRTKEKHEVDFAIIINDYPETLLEVKTSSAKITPGLRYIGSKFPASSKVLLVKNLRVNQEVDDISICNLSEWLAKLEV